MKTAIAVFLCSITLASAQYRTVISQADIDAATNVVWGDAQYPNAHLLSGARPWTGTNNAGANALTNLSAVTVISNGTITVGTDVFTGPDISEWIANRALIEGNDTDIATIDGHNDVQDLNIAANAMRTAVNGALGSLAMTGGHIDQYEDQTGINAATSTNENYDASADAYFAKAYGALDATTAVGTWGFNDNAASTVVIASIGANGTLGGGDNTSVKNTTGKINDAFTLNGTDDYVSYGDLDATNFTIMCWFKTTGTGNNRTLIAKATAYNQYTANYYLWVNVGNLVGGFGYTSQQKAITGAATVNDGSWHHAAITYDLTTLTLYLDGAVEGTPITTSIVPVQNSANAETGRMFNNGWGDETIDDVRIFTNALTLAQIGFIYNEGTGTEATNITVGGNMLLQSNVHTGTVDYTEGILMGYWNETNGVVLNTDLKGYIANDGGSTWQQVTLARDPNGAGIDSETVLISGQTNFPAGSVSNHIVYKWETFNDLAGYTNKGTALLYKEP